MLMDAHDTVREADTQPNGLRSSWRTRVALCRAILAVRKVSTSVQASAALVVLSRVHASFCVCVWHICQVFHMYACSILVNYRYASMLWRSQRAELDQRSVLTRTRATLRTHQGPLRQLGPSVLEDEDLDACLARMADLLADDTYPARCAAASLTPQLYPYFSDNQARAQPDSSTCVCLCKGMCAFLDATL